REWMWMESEPEPVTRMARGSSISRTTTLPESPAERRAEKSMTYASRRGYDSADSGRPLAGVAPGSLFAAAVRASSCASKWSSSSRVERQNAHGWRRISSVSRGTMRSWSLTATRSAYDVLRGPFALLVDDGQESQS